jgi:hypothetical protein
MLVQGLNRDQRPTDPGEVPVESKLVGVPGRPRQNEAQRTGRERPADDSTIERDRGAISGVAGMEVRREVIGVVDRDDDAVEP